MTMKLHFSVQHTTTITLCLYKTTDLSDKCACGCGVHVGVCVCGGGGVHTQLCVCTCMHVCVQLCAHMLSQWTLCL